MELYIDFELLNSVFGDLVSDRPVDQVVLSAYMDCDRRLAKVRAEARKAADEFNEGQRERELYASYLSARKLALAAHLRDSNPEIVARADSLVDGVSRTEPEVMEEF